jgi:hypothetical protein
MLDSDEQPMKAKLSIFVTVSGMAMLVKSVQPSKALSLIIVTELGIVMMVSSVHPLKALLPILFTESGITVEEQPRINSLSVISIIALQLLRESYTAFPSATFIFLMPEQSVKAVEWIRIQI